MPYFEVIFVILDPVLTVFWQSGDLFNYTGGQRCQNVISIYFRPIENLTLGSMKCRKVPKSTKFSGFPQNRLKSPNLVVFRRKVPFNRLMTRTKVSKMTPFLGSKYPSTFYSRIKVVRFETPVLVVFRHILDISGQSTRARAGVLTTFARNV